MLLCQKTLQYFFKGIEKQLNIELALWSVVCWFYAIKKNELAELMLSSHPFAVGTRNWKAVTHVSGKMKGTMSPCFCSTAKDE